MPTQKTIVKRSVSSSSSSLASFDTLVRKVRETFVFGRERVRHLEVR